MDDTQTLSARQAQEDTALDALTRPHTRVPLTDLVGLRAEEHIGLYRGDPELSCDLWIVADHRFTLESGETAPHPLTTSSYLEGDEDLLLADAWTVDRDIRADLASRAAGQGGALPETLTEAYRAACQTRSEALYDIGPLEPLGA